MPWHAKLPDTDIGKTFDIFDIFEHDAVELIGVLVGGWAYEVWAVVTNQQSDIIPVRHVIFLILRPVAPVKL